MVVGPKVETLARGMQTFYRCQLQAKKACVRLIAVGWIPIGLLFSTGCSSISTTHTQDICAARFSPSDPVQVEILPTVPARPHIELGQVWAYSSNPSGDNSKLESALCKEAAKLGADAFVVWHDEIRTDAPAFHGQERRLFKKVPGRTVIGAAIKYQ